MVTLDHTKKPGLFNQNSDIASIQWKAKIVVSTFSALKKKIGTSVQVSVYDTFA